MGFKKWFKNKARSPSEDKMGVREANRYFQVRKRLYLFKESKSEYKSENVSNCFRKGQIAIED